MNYRDALDLLASDPHVWRYREMTADDYHDPIVRDAWRVRLVREATGKPESNREVIPGLGSLADLPGPARIEPGCRPCH
jgi:hypothetical protein